MYADFALSAEMVPIQNVTEVFAVATTPAHIDRIVEYISVLPEFGVEPVPLTGAKIGNVYVTPPEAVGYLTSDHNLKFVLVMSLEI